MPLEKELAYYEKAKEELLKNHEGKYALVKDEAFLGAFDTAENAYNEGIKRFGQQSFLVKKISRSEEVYRNQALAVGLMNARI